MNVHEKIFRKSLWLSKSIRLTKKITDRHRLKWHRLKKLIKKHKHLKSRRYILKHYSEVRGDNELSYLLEYCSDKWTRNRMYRVDKLFQKKAMNNNTSPKESANGE